jgi:hypothetical protein
MGNVAEMRPDDPLALIHFFGGAFFLAIYHVYIVATSRQGVQYDSEEDPFAASSVR